MSHFLIISDNDQPTIISSIDYPAEGKDNVVLTCVPATSDSIIAFEWFKDNRNISRGINGTYVFPGKRGTNSGTYQCRVYTKNILRSPLSNSTSVTFLCKYCLFH